MDRTSAPLGGSARSTHLDAFRAIAAFEVFAGHMRQYFLADYSSVIRQGPGVRFLFLATSFGHAAVMVFFVLSGYLISRGAIDRIRSGQWSWSSYIVQRWTRLYAVLVPALVLGATWDALSMNHLPPSLASIADQIRSRFGLGTWFANLFFLQEIAAPVFGSNGPLWSLSYEFWYYLAFPCFAMAALGRGRPRRIVCAILGTGILIVVGGQIARYFTIWLLGTAVAMLPVPSRNRAFLLTAVAGAALSVLLVRSAMGGGADDFAHDLPIGIAFAALSWGAIGIPAPTRGWYAAMSGALAARSYTLYLVHYPVIVFVSGVLLGGPRWQPTALGILQTTAFAIMVLAYTQLVWSATEARTGRLRALTTRVLEHGGRRILAARRPGGGSARLTVGPKTSRPPPDGPNT
jgi:peptidoglycan/LPS O-acetylase OafA/YrhL